MKILFFGTSDFATPTLDALVSCSRHTLVGVVTQPDRPSGRGRHINCSDVKVAALRYELPILQPRRVKHASFIETARELAPDVLVLASFGQIIPQTLLELPKFGPINVHGSLLPAYRGAAPIQYSILNGDLTTGVTTMWMDATLDTGDILLQRSLSIEPDDTTGTLTPRLAGIGAELLMETLELLEQGICPRIPQDHSLATFTSPILPADSLIDWGDSAKRIRNQILALSPRPGCITKMKGKLVKVWAAKALDGESNGAQGAVCSITKEGVLVHTGNSLLCLMEVQQENSRRMNASDWARGARITPGDVFD